MSRSRLASLLAITLLVAACGAAGASPSASGAPPPTSGSAAPSTSAPAGGGSGGCAVAAADAAPDQTVTIKDFTFGPDPVTIRAGQTVAWTNADSAAHEPALLDGSCDTGPIAKGLTKAIVFSQAGTYRYHCVIHPSMTATVEVTS